MNFQGNIDFSDPKVQQAWAFFQQQTMQQQQQQQLQQQILMQYQYFCQINGLNPNNPNSLQFFQQQQNANNFQQQNLNNFQQQNSNNFQQQNLNNFQQNSEHNYINSNIQNTGDKEIIPSGIKSNPNEPKHIIPRGEKTLYLNEKGENKLNYNNTNPNIINISFTASTGLKLIIATPTNITIKQLIKKYLDRLGLPFEHADNNLTFLFNGGKVDPESNELLSEKFKNNMVITVFDKAGVIGALNN